MAKVADMAYAISEKVAFLCGVWNGLVDFIGGTLKLIGTILSAPFDLARNFDRNLELYDNFIVAIKEFKFSEFWEALVKVWEKIKEYFTEHDGNDINTDKVAYAIGFGLAFIGTFFVPFTQIAKVGNISKIGKAFIPTKYLEDISNTVNKASKAVANTGQKIADDIYLTINKMLSLLKKGKQAFVEFFEKIWKSIADWFLKRNQYFEKYLKGLTSTNWLSLGLLRLMDDGVTILNLQRLVKRHKIIEEAFFDIITHGHKKGTKVGIGSKLVKADEFSRILSKGDKWEKGQNIRLIVCHSGRNENSFAAKLAKLLEVEVTAPTKKIRLDDAGEFIHESGGKFITYKPDGTFY